MLVLCLDNPKHHERTYGDRTSRTIHIGLKDETDSRGIDFRLALDASVADFVLANEKVDLVVIHHSGWEDIDMLKRKHPAVRFAAVGGSIIDKEHARSGSVAEGYRQNLLRHYDLILDWYHEIWPALGVSKA